MTARHRLCPSEKPSIATTKDRDHQKQNPSKKIDGFVSSLSPPNGGLRLMKNPSIFGSSQKRGVLIPICSRFESVTFRESEAILTLPEVCQQPEPAEWRAFPCSVEAGKISSFPASSGQRRECRRAKRRSRTNRTERLLPFLQRFRAP
ncbi:hypothetical protein GHC20_07925 [Brucella sp. 2280]|nr:hypothetical protein GHC20_07925 [Brucella sp. 2280]